MGSKVSAAGSAITGAVANALPYIPTWLRVMFIPGDFQRMSREGYKASAVVYSCVSIYARKFPEPPIRAYDSTDKPSLKHPVLALLRRPNRWMNEARFMMTVIIYMLIGGDCYIHKLRNKTGNVIGLRPLHAGQITPVPSQYNEVDHYRFSIGDGKYTEVPTEDVIQIQWPSVDPDKPWMSYPPLLAIAREVDTTAEIARYTYALFKNDATPLTIINIPADADDSDLDDVKNRSNTRFGGDNRGSLAVLKGDAKITRLGLGLKELDSENALNVPEAHIASAFGIPAIILGLNIGLRRATFANYGEARSAFTEDTLCPLWRIVEDALTQGLLNEFTEPFTLRFDLDRVVALRENAEVVNKTTILKWTSGITTLNETRSAFGEEPMPDEQGNLFWFDLMTPTNLVPVQPEQPAPATDKTQDPVEEPETYPESDDSEKDEDGVTTI